MSKEPAPAARAAPPTDDGRRRALLEAAIGVFMRFGYRKTSMDEVARTAQISRQGLYLHFSTKEDLFRSAVEHVLKTALKATGAAFRDPELDLPARLGRAFDLWVGRYAGMMGGGASDLAQAMGNLVGPLYARYEGAFVDSVAKAMTAGGLVAPYRAVGLSARNLAETLYATARGLKYSSPSPEAFSRSMSLAIRALCAPLGAR